MEASFRYLYSGSSFWKRFGQHLASDGSRGKPHQSRVKQELTDIGSSRGRRVLLSSEMCSKFATSASFLLLLQLTEVLFQPAIASHQASDIKQMNGPSGGVSGVKKLYGVHCPLRCSATFGFLVSADGPLSSPSKDSSP